MIARQLLFASLISTVLLSPIEWVRSQTPAKTSVGTALSVTDAGQWRTIQKGGPLRAIALESADPSYTAGPKMLGFDSKNILPRVLIVGQSEKKSAKAKTFPMKNSPNAAI